MAVNTIASSYEAHSLSDSRSFGWLFDLGLLGNKGPLPLYQLDGLQKHFERWPAVGQLVQDLGHSLKRCVQ